MKDSTHVKNDLPSRHAERLYGTIQSVAATGTYRVDLPAQVGRAGAKHGATTVTAKLSDKIVALGIVPTRGDPAIVCDGVIIG